jgi:hypothetical protein
MGQHLGAPRLLLGANGRRVFAVLGARRHRLFYRWPFANFIEPSFDIGKFIEVDVATLPERCPWLANHIRDGVLAVRQVALSSYGVPDSSRRRCDVLRYCCVATTDENNGFATEPEESSGPE